MRTAREIIADRSHARKIGSSSHSMFSVWNASNTRFWLSLPSRRLE